MKWLNWLLADNKEAAAVRTNTAAIAQTLAEINEKLRANAGLPDVQKVRQIGGRK